MSEFDTPKPHNLVTIEEVCRQTYILNRPAPASLTDSGDFLTARDFGRAGIDAQKTENYGQGVMRDIALQMVGIEAENRWTVNGKEGNWIVRGTPEYDLHWRIFYLMNNPEMVKAGSRNRLLLGTQLVYDVWRAGEGMMPSTDLPLLGKVGRRVVSMLFQEEQEAKRLAEYISDAE